MPAALSREQVLSVLCDLAFAVGGEVSESALLTRTLQRFLFHTGFPVGLILAHAPADPGSLVACRLQVAIGDHRLVREQGRTLHVPGEVLAAVPAVIEDGELLGRLGTRRPMAAAFSLPIEGYGHILLLSPRPPGVTAGLTEVFLPVLSRLATAIRLCQSHEREVERRVEHGTRYDALTGLPSASRLGSELALSLAASRESGRSCAVAYLDLDDFVRVNEKRGRDAGDAILVALARRLQGLLLPGELLARMQGDEFALLVPDVPARRQAEDRILWLQERLRDPLAAGSGFEELTASAGIALFPADGADPELLLRHAQMAMLEAKQAGRGAFRFFDAEQNRLVHERRNRVERLAQALRKGQLLLHYQPKVEMRSGRVVGAEALLRWADPDRGLRSPGDFLPQVDESGLIVEIGEWVIREALRQGAAWRAQGLVVPISVNVASLHLHEPDFVARVDAALAEVAGSEPRLLELEILESTAIRDVAHARAVMQACRARGIGIALDDFGTGYSSLAYLVQLPVSTVKIDQLFVRSLFEQQTEPAVVRAIVQIARVLECDVVAEGVETAEHGMALASMGCRLAQGFVVSRPVPAPELAAWAAAYRPPTEWSRWAAPAWSPGLHELLRARAAHAQWARELGRAEAAAAGIPGLADCPLTRWLETGPHGAAAPEALARLRSLHADLHVALARPGSCDGPAAAFRAYLEFLLDGGPAA